MILCYISIFWSSWPKSKGFVRDHRSCSSSYCLKGISIFLTEKPFPLFPRIMIIPISMFILTGTRCGSMILQIRILIFWILYMGLPSINFFKNPFEFMIQHVFLLLTEYFITKLLDSPFSIIPCTRLIKWIACSHTVLMSIKQPHPCIVN